MLNPNFGKGHNFLIILQKQTFDFNTSSEKHLSKIRSKMLHLMLGPKLHTQSYLASKIQLYNGFKHTSHVTMQALPLVSLERSHLGQEVSRSDSTKPQHSEVDACHSKPNQSYLLTNIRSPAILERHDWSQQFGAYLRVHGNNDKHAASTQSKYL